MDEPEQPQQQPPQAPQPASPQRRLQELRSIPERDRTDAQWDELNEIEIALASANRAGGPDPNIRQENKNGQGRGQQRRGGGGGGGGGPQNGRQGGNQGQQHHHHRQNRGRQRPR